MRLVLHRRVRSDVDEIMDHYERAEQPELAQDFYRELRAFMLDAARQPHRSPYGCELYSDPGPPIAGSRAGSVGPSAQTAPRPETPRAPLAGWPENAPASPTAHPSCSPNLPNPLPQPSPAVLSTLTSTRNTRPALS